MRIKSAAGTILTEMFAPPIVALEIHIRQIGPLAATLKLVGLGLVVFLIVSLAVACGGVQSAIGPDLVRSYAECLADPAMPLHVAAGAELDANVHDAGLRAELKAGETTMAEIRAAFEMFCE